MDYTASVPFAGNADKALDLAVSALTAVGFRLVERTAASVEMDGPGTNGNWQSDLLGASRVRAAVGGGELAVEADLGGVRRVARFLTLFPPALGVSLGVVFLVVFGLLLGPGALMIPAVGVPAVIAAVWLVVGPLMVRGMRAQTRRALDVLLANMAAVGSGGGAGAG